MVHPPTRTLPVGPANFGDHPPANTNTKLEGKIGMLHGYILAKDGGRQIGPTTVILWQFWHVIRNPVIFVLDQTQDMSFNHSHQWL
jgi:hypothetical protein